MTRLGKVTHSSIQRSNQGTVPIVVICTEKVNQDSALEASQWLSWNQILGIVREI
jgi:hypothetical protein